MMKHYLLHTTVAFAPATDMAPGVAEKLKKRPQPPLTSEPETPNRARQLHAADAKESALTKQPPTSAVSRTGRPQAPRAPPELDAYSIGEFCRPHSLTPYLFYKLQREGLAPRVMLVGARKLISAEAAAKWRRARERTAKPRPERGSKQTTI
jgi:hypothetical protein